jgi:D-3-phosphoglycerate dehydrogenase / 2-oxoglutarate reductase
MRILHLESDQYPLDALKALDNHNVHLFHCETQADLYHRLSTESYDVIFARIGLAIDEKAIAMQPELKYIVTATTGTNHIDMDAASARNILVISLKGESEFLSTVKSTAEHTWALLLALVRNLTGIIKNVHNGYWTRTSFLAEELDGKKIGIIGFGRLGKIVSNYALAFGMDVLVHDTDESSYADNKLVLPCSKEYLLQNSDVVVLLVSHSVSNNNLLSSDDFQMMKQGAYFINTSRGELVDEQALLNSLTNGQLKGAALDVLSNDSAWNEKIESSLDLLEYSKMHSNLIITSHTGGFGKTSIHKTRRFITNKFISKIQQ